MLWSKVDRNWQNLTIYACKGILLAEWLKMGGRLANRRLTGESQSNNQTCINSPERPGIMLIGDRKELGGLTLDDLLPFSAKG